MINPVILLEDVGPVRVITLHRPEKKNAFDIALTEDLSITFLGERDQDYPFRVYECLALRVKRPPAICTIE